MLKSEDRPLPPTLDICVCVSHMQVQGDMKPDSSSAPIQIDVQVRCIKFIMEWKNNEFISICFLAAYPLQLILNIPHFHREDESGPEAEMWHIYDWIFMEL